MRIYAHRGYRQDNLFPENTISAFAAAVQQGADGFEFDVRLSRDGKAVVFHDNSLHKVGIPKFIHEVSSDELQQVELGKGIFLPMLDEVLERFGNLAFLNIEIKSPNAASEVARLLHEYKLDLSPNYLIVSSFLEQPLMEIKKIDSRIPTGLLYLSPWGKIKLAKRLSCSALHPFFGKTSIPGLAHIHKFFGRRNIRIAQKQEFQINAWTINSSRLIKELLRYRISGIITDNLNAALKLREKYSMD